MINFDIAVDTIRDNHGFTPNSHDSSYYRTFTVEGCKSLQVRISNHGTHLWTWYDREYDPSATINYCIVFSEDFKHDSNISVDIRKGYRAKNKTTQKYLIPWDVYYAMKQK
jgi:hypothetical protein